MDLKAIVDRRLNEINEELPLKLRSEIQNFEKTQQLQLHDVAQKITMIQEVSIRTRDQLKGKMVQMSEQIQRLELQNRETEYKLSSALKQVEINNTYVQGM